jgi:hypothetical protein
MRFACQTISIPSKAKAWKLEIPLFLKLRADGCAKPLEMEDTDCAEASRF